MSHLQQPLPRRREAPVFGIVFGVTAAIVVVTGLTVAMTGEVVSAPAAVDSAAIPHGMPPLAAASSDPSVPDAKEALSGWHGLHEDPPSTF